MYLPDIRKKNKLNNTYTGHVPLVEQELLTFPEHMNVTPVFSGLQSLVFCAVFNRSSCVCLPLHCLFFDYRFLLLFVIFRLFLKV